MVGCGQRAASGLYYWKSALEDEKAKRLEKQFIVKQADFSNYEYRGIVLCGYETSSLNKGWWVCRGCAVKLGLIW